MPNNYTYQDLKDNIDYIKETKRLIKNAITSKGQSISDNDTFRSYVSKVDAISYGTPTLDANATSSDVLTGKFGYAGNTKINGTIPNNGALNYNPSTSAQNIPAGYTSGGTLNAVTSAIDNNIKAENIKKDVTILDTTGTWDGDHTEYIERINELNAKIDRYKSEGKSDSATGNSIVLTNSTELFLKDIKPKGKTEQFITTGKNYFNANAIGNTSIVVSDAGKIIKLPVYNSGIGYTSTNKTLRELCPNLKVGDVVYLKFTRNLGTTYNNYIYFDTPNVLEEKWEANASKTITETMLNSNIVLYGNKYTEGETAQCILTDFRIIKNETDEYESYTGGIPSPNPDYPQEINNVEGKNKFDKDAEVIQIGHISNYSYSNGIYTIIPTGKGNPQFKLKCKIPAGSYVLNSSTSLSEATQLVNDNNTLNNFWANYKNQSFTLEETSEYMIFNWNNPGNTNPIILNLNTLMISKEGGTYVSYNCIQIAKSNKNLFDIISNFPITKNGLTFTKNSDGTITINGTASTTFTQIFTLKNQFLNGNYVITHNTMSGSISQNCYMTIQDSNNNNISDRIYGGGTASSLSLSNITIVTAGIYINSGTTFINYTVGTQLEAGTVATSFIGHQGKTYNFPLVQGQKLYEGSYLADDGIHHVRGQIVLRGDNKFTVTWDSSYNKFNIYKVGLNAKVFGNILSNYITNNTTEKLSIQESNSINTIWVFDKNHYFNESVEDFKTWLSTHNLIVEYELAEEEVIPYTSEQQAAWEEMKRLKTYTPYTKIEYISSLNADMEIEYFLNN